MDIPLYGAFSEKDAERKKVKQKKEKPPAHPSTH
jgi:hypothetical protein